MNDENRIIDLGYARRAQEAAVAKAYVVEQIRCRGLTPELENVGIFHEALRASCDLAKDQGKESALNGLQWLEVIAATGRKATIRDAREAFETGTIPDKYKVPGEQAK